MSSEQFWAWMGSFGIRSWVELFWVIFGLAG